MPSTLVFTWGNPSRGDDGVGYEFYELFCKEDISNLEVLTDFQLQIEHVVDFENRDLIVFVDASVSAKAPFEFYQIQADQDDSYTTHAMSPQSLLCVYEKVNKKQPPTAYLLLIRAYEFELGTFMSEKAMINLQQAVHFLKQEIAERTVLPSF